MDSAVIAGLRPARKTDRRPDDEIVALFEKFQAPTQNEKNVWGYWHAGFDAMPSWQKRNVIDWVRKLDDTWTIRVLDSVAGSPNHILNFVGLHLLPTSFASNSFTGIHASVHSGDVVRLALLELYGGVWMDVGTLLVRDLDDLWDVLVSDETPYEMAAMTMPLRNRGEMKEEIMMNGFIMARRDNPFIKRWHQIFLSLWTNANDSGGFHKHPILRHLRLYQPSKLFKCSDEEYTDYLAQVLCAERLRDLQCSDGFNGRDYYENRIFLMPAFKELLLQRHSGWNGNEELRLLTATHHKAEAEDARLVVHDLLQNTVAIKLSRGPRGGSTTTWLADLLDDPTNKDAEIASGTFGLYLREKILGFDQQRTLIPMTIGPLTTKVWKAGLTEICRLGDSEQMEESLQM